MAAPEAAAAAASEAPWLTAVSASWDHYSPYSTFWEQLNSTQLYLLIVGATMAAAWIVLGAGPVKNPPESSLRLHEPSRASTSRSNTAAASSSLPEPRWHIFQWTNVGITLSALAVVGMLLAQSSSWEFVSHHVSWMLWLGWSVCLCYFLGFFGVSFVHDYTTPMILMENSQENKEANHERTTLSTTASSKQWPEPSSCEATIEKDKSKSDSCREGCVKEPVKTTLHPPTIQALTDAQVAKLVLSQTIKDYELEKILDSPLRAVQVRRLALEQTLSKTSVLTPLPVEPSLDYQRVHGTNCEIVIGYVPIPVGLVGPLTLNDETNIYIPMATTEGCLVASTNRGIKAMVTQGGAGAYASIVRDGMTRAPCLRCKTARQAVQLAQWVQTPTNFATLQQAFATTTRFGQLQSCKATVAGRNVYLRLTCFAGDAMGMNMVSKGSMAVIELLQDQFDFFELVALSGNLCTDKKAAAMNWIEGRGKSVVVEATISQHVVRTILKTTVQAMVQVNINKNLIGSAMAGVVGGFNAHASNIVTAIFLATGQDPAQNVESSNCITLLEETEEGDLWISCTMPSLEVGTVGGGTSLEAQGACLDIMGCQGTSRETPGHNAQRLAMIIAAATMAGELSLLAALAANTLVQAHMQHNRKK